MYISRMKMLKYMFMVVARFCWMLCFSKAFVKCMLEFKYMFVCVCRSVDYSLIYALYNMMF